MTWTSKIKDLSLHSATAHPTGGSGIVGRVPGVSKINFGPLDLYGAAARCGHLHAINPALVTPESLMIAALVEQYVDDVSSDFAILSGAANFKDFVKSYFAGTVASGLAYLQMINEGYVWSDHFENVGGGNTAVAKSPDFVFDGPGTGVALVESKGTRSARLTAFDGTVDTGYTDQVEPHLGFTVGGANASHGYCIGGWLTSTTKAELLIHHTAVPVAVGGGGSRSQPSSTIQRQNYATAFTLAHSAQLGEQLRGGEADGRYDVPFLRIEWGGRSWLTGLASLGWPAWRWDDEFARLPPSISQRARRRYLFGQRLPIFAIEETIASAVLGRFLSVDSASADFAIQPIDREVDFVTRADDGSQSGAVFPDGLAVIRSDFRIENPIVWDPKSRQFRA
ncbi:hypothetical protein [Novosphingobium humi]|uniref:Phage tail protein n=1 Tax=Novosphingobium humi TaxID=2282397 RepID=A0ABY7U0M9_9SPHN|nr:hypothetical protein [Novosphingobium humi]WCT79083.1 hypothetical protein PQ457_18900 [Novosphingobium humi]